MDESPQDAADVLAADLVQQLQQRADAILDALEAPSSRMSPAEAGQALRQLKAKLPRTRLGGLNYQLARFRRTGDDLPLRRCIQDRGLPVSDLTVAGLRQAAALMPNEDVEEVWRYLDRLVGPGWPGEGIEPNLLQRVAVAGVCDVAALEQWTVAGVAPKQIADWWKQGARSPQQAAAWLAAGVLDPAALARWRGAGVDAVEDLQMWRSAGVQSATAVRRWRRAGVDDPEVAKDWRAAGQDVQEAARWHGRTPGEATLLEAWGVRPNQAAQLEGSVASVQPWVEAGLPFDLAADCCAAMPQTNASQLVEALGVGGLRSWQRAGLLAWGDSGLPRREAGRRAKLGLQPDDPAEAFSRSALLTVVRNDVAGERVVQVVLTDNDGVVLRSSGRADRAAASLAEAVSTFPDLVRLLAGERVAWSTRRQQDRRVVSAALTSEDPDAVDDLDEDQQELWSEWRDEEECGQSWHEEVPATLDGERLMALQTTPSDWVLLPHLEDLLEQVALVASHWNSSTYSAVGNAGSGSFALCMLAPQRYLEVQVVDFHVQDSDYFTDDRSVELVVADYLRRSGTQDELLRRRPELVADHRMVQLREQLAGDDFLLSNLVDEERVLDLLLPQADRRTADEGLEQVPAPVLPVGIGAWEAWGNGSDDVRMATLFLDDESGQYVMESLVIEEVDGFDIANGDTEQTYVGSDLGGAALRLLDWPGSRLVADGWDATAVCIAIGPTFVRDGRTELTVNGHECIVLGGRLRPGPDGVY